MDKRGVLYIPEPLLVRMALSAREHRLGLKYRELPEPIAFLFDSLAPRYFWMADTPAPLDIYFCRQGKVLGKEEGVPFSLRRLGGYVCDLVVEIPQESKISLGSHLSLDY